MANNIYSSDDVIRGGEGNDKIYGGAGADFAIHFDDAVV